MQPSDQGQLRVQDQRQADVAPAAAIQDQVPADNAVTLTALNRGDAEVGKPAIDVGS